MSAPLLATLTLALLAADGTCRTERPFLAMAGDGAPVVLVEIGAVVDDFEVEAKVVDVVRGKVEAKTLVLRTRARSGAGSRLHATSYPRGSRWLLLLDRDGGGSLVGDCAEVATPVVGDRVMLRPRHESTREELQRRHQTQVEGRYGNLTLAEARSILDVPAPPFTSAPVEVLAGQDAKVLASLWDGRADKVEIIAALRESRPNDATLEPFWRHVLEGPLPQACRQGPVDASQSLDPCRKAAAEALAPSMSAERLAAWAAKLGNGAETDGLILRLLEVAVGEARSRDARHRRLGLAPHLARWVALPSVDEHQRQRARQLIDQLCRDEGPHAPGCRKSPPSLQELSSKDPAVRRAALRALEDDGEGQRMPAVVAALTAAEPEVAAEAAAAASRVYVDQALIGRQEGLARKLLRIQMDTLVRHPGLAADVGGVAHRFGETGRAEAIFRAALSGKIERDQDRADLQFRLARLLLSLRRKPEALQLARDLIQGPETPVCYSEAPWVAGCQEVSSGRAGALLVGLAGSPVILSGWSRREGGELRLTLAIELRGAEAGDLLYRPPTVSTATVRSVAPETGRRMRIVRGKSLEVTVVAEMPRSGGRAIVTLPVTVGTDDGKAYVGDLLCGVELP